MRMKNNFPDTVSSLLPPFLFSLTSIDSFKPSLSLYTKRKAPSQRRAPKKNIFRKEGMEGNGLDLDLDQVDFQIVVSIPKTQNTGKGTKADTLYLLAVEAVSSTTQQAWQWMKARRYSEFHGLHREVSSLTWEVVFWMLTAKV